MAKVRLSAVLFYVCVLAVQGNDDGSSEKAVEDPEKEAAILKEAEGKISAQVRAILDHYKQDDPVGLPGAPVQDPMPIPNMKQSFSMATMNFKDASVFGLSQFRIEHIKSDLAELKVSIGLRLEKLEIRGNYTMSTWVSRSQGRFNVTLLDVYIEGIARLEVDRGGRLQAQDINMDITFAHILINFENLGFMGSIFQGIINSVGTFLFDSIKPFILSQVNTNIRGDLNKHISEIPQRFPNSISPVDMAIATGRQLVRERGYDPYMLPNYNYTAGILRVDLTHAWVHGFSSFYRVGDLTITMIDHVVQVGVHMGTQKLKGRCLWEVGVGGMVSRSGTAVFTVDYIHVRIKTSQAMDVRNKPTLDELDIKMGNIQVRVNGAGTLDYVVEFVVNVLPNVLRYQIMDAIEGPIKRYVQESLDRIDVEAVLDEKLPQLDERFGSINAVPAPAPAEEKEEEEST